MENKSSYLGSGRALVNSMKKYGRKFFIKEILFILDSEDEMNIKEKLLVTEEFVSRDDTYNLGVGGEGGPHFKGKKMPKEIVERNSTRRKGKPGKKGLTPWNKGVILSEEQRNKISQSMRDKNLKHSDETKEKISKSLKGRSKSHSDETKKKMSEAKIGKKLKPWTEEQKKKHKEKMKEVWEKRKSGSLV
jgi:hypothetical protein